MPCIAQSPHASWYAQSLFTTLATEQNLECHNQRPKSQSKLDLSAPLRLFSCYHILLLNPATHRHTDKPTHSHTSSPTRVCGGVEARQLDPDTAHTCVFLVERRGSCLHGGLCGTVGKSCVGRLSRSLTGGSCRRQGSREDKLGKSARRISRGDRLREEFLHR